MRTRAFSLAIMALSLTLLAGPATAQEKVAGTYGQGPDVFSLAGHGP